MLVKAKQLKVGQIFRPSSSDPRRIQKIEKIWVALNRFCRSRKVRGIRITFESGYTNNLHNNDMVEVEDWS